MPRLLDKARGVVVSVDDATAKALGAGYEPIPEAKPEPEPKPTPKRPARKP